MGPSTAAPKSEHHEKNGRAAAVTTKLKLKEIEHRVSKEAAGPCMNSMEFCGTYLQWMQWKIVLGCLHGGPPGFCTEN